MCIYNSRQDVNLFEIMYINNSFINRLRAKTNNITFISQYIAVYSFDIRTKHLQIDVTLYI